MHLDPQSTGAKVHWFASACSLAAFCVGWAADSGKIPPLVRCLLNAGSRGAHLQLQPLLLEVLLPALADSELGSDIIVDGTLE